VNAGVSDKELAVNPSFSLPAQVADQIQWRREASPLGCLPSSSGRQPSGAGAQTSGQPGTDTVTLTRSDAGGSRVTKTLTIKGSMSMSYSDSLHEQRAGAHRRDLLRAAEKQRI